MLRNNITCTTWISLLSVQYFIEMLWNFVYFYCQWAFPEKNCTLHVEDINFFEVDFPGFPVNFISPIFNAAYHIITVSSFYIRFFFANLYGNFFLRQNGFSVITADRIFSFTVEDPEEVGKWVDGTLLYCFCVSAFCFFVFF